MIKKRTMLIITIFIIAILCVVVALNVMNSRTLRGILEDSVSSQLISTSVAAREMIDVDDFISYNSVEDVEADRADYNATLGRLRSLANDVGAEYIYALKKIGDAYYFVFDTDPVDEEIFIEYELSPVHAAAFTGKEAADIMNVDDIYGSFHTGAVPIMKDGAVVGIVSTDIADVHLARSMEAERTNLVVLVVILSAVMAVMLVIVFRLLGRLDGMQKELAQMAHYDTITGLPNRQYLYEYLTRLTQDNAGKPFALFFIDIDNFKTVNDHAGHDAGDELLRHIALYLEGNQENVVSFRPAAGRLNIAARIGGDEFIQVVSGVENGEQAAGVAQDLIAGFHSEYFDKYIRKYHVGLSIGIALYPGHSENYHVLIKYADIAMYHAKRAGKNGYRVYDEDMEQKDEK